MPGFINKELFLLFNGDQKSFTSCFLTLLNINVGDYILAVNGYPLGKNDNIFSHLEDMADKQVTLRIARQKNGQGARNVVVEPIKNENALRLWSWVEENRKAVDKATEGRVGYVYLPNTAGSGFTFFNRLFFPQVDKDAIIIDERSNGGGQAANYVTDVLSRIYHEIYSYFDTRYVPFCIY